MSINTTSASPYSLHGRLLLVLIALLAFCAPVLYPSYVEALPLPQECLTPLGTSLTPGVDVIRAAHVEALRTCVNRVRTVNGLPTVTWADSTALSGGPIKLSHLIELRNAVREIYRTFSATPYQYGTVPTQGVAVRASDWLETRQAIAGLAFIGPSAPPPPVPPAPLAATAPTRGNSLAPGESLRVGEWLMSSNGRYRLEYQTDGNVVLRRTLNGTPTWATNTAAIGTLSMQAEDGNLVLYDYTGTSRWVPLKDDGTPGTAGHPNARFVLQDDGNLVVYAGDGLPVWTSHTDESQTSDCEAQVYILGEDSSAADLPGFSVVIGDGCSWEATASNSQAVALLPTTGLGSAKIAVTVDPVALGTGDTLLQVAGTQFSLSQSELSPGQNIGEPCIRIVLPCSPWVPSEFCRPFTLCVKPPSLPPTGGGGSGGGGSGQVGCGPLPEQTPCPMTITLRADLEADMVLVTLTGGSKAGAMLTLGPAMSELPLPLVAAPHPEGTWEFKWSRLAKNGKPFLETLPLGQYNQLVAKWGNVSASIPLRFNVMGDYIHTQYNIPHEEYCTAPLIDAFVEGTFGSCQYDQQIRVPADFAREAWENGSGYRTAPGQVLTHPWFCPEANIVHPQTYTFRQTDAVRGASLLPLDEASVAMYRFDPHLKLGDRVLIVGFGSGVGTAKIVKDFCPACSESSGHLDNLVALSSCNKQIGNLGGVDRRWRTIRVNR